MQTLTPHPVLYRPDVEIIEDDVDQVVDELRNTMLKMSSILLEHTGHATRSVHTKSFGLLRGTLEVLQDLPPALAQGLFAAPKTYDMVARFSSPPSEKLDDRVSLPRAVALKVLHVEGERLAGSEDDRTQDFLMVDGPVFAAKNAKGFLRQVKRLSTTTDKAEGGKRILSVLLRGASAALGAVGWRVRQSSPWEATNSFTPSALASSRRSRCASAGILPSSPWSRYRRPSRL